jgi:PAS domain S-box/PAS domain S-box/PAS domain S-box/PAS domain S-box
MKVMKKSKTSESKSETEIALQESERKFSDTIKYLDQGYYSCMMDGEITEHNRAFNKVLGIDISKDMKGAKLPDFWLNPDERKVYLQELMTRGFIMNYLINAKTISGEKVVVMANSHLMKDERGEPVRIEGTFTDFTRMKLMEEALKESETKYRTLFENAQVGMYRSKIDGSAMLDVNKKFGEILGLTREESLGKAGRILWANSEDRDKMMKLLKEQDGNLYNYEARLLAKNGEVRDVLASIKLNPEKDSLEGTFVDITDRKEADKKIKDDEEKFRALFEKSPLGIAYNEMIFDTSGKPIDYRFLEVNEAYIKIIGLDPRGKKVTEAFPGIEKFSFDWIGTFGHVAQTGEQIYFEQFFESDNRWYDCVAFQSKKNQYAVVFQDISERKRAEEALRNSETFLNSIIDQSPVPMWISDDKGILIRINKACCSILKITEQDVIGKYNVIEDNIVREQGLLSDVRKVFDNGETVRFEIRYNTSKLEGLSLESEAEVILDTTIFPIKDYKGKVTNAVIQHMDITERKRSEEQLREASLYARNLIEASLDPLVTISSDGKIMDVNKATEEVTGDMRSKLIGSDFSDYFTEPEKAKAGYRKVLADRSVTDYPLTLRHTSGKTTDVLYNATVYHNEKGIIQGVFAAARDITVRKLAEEEIRKPTPNLRTV